MFEALRLQPLCVPRAPGLLAGKDAPLTQHHRRNRLPFATQVVYRHLARPHQVPHRLVRLVRHPHRGQFAGAQQTSKLGRVASVRLHPIARAPRDQGGRNDSALMTQLRQLPVQPIPGRTGFITEVQWRMPLLQLAHKTTDRFRVSADLTKEPDLSLTARLGNRCRMTQLGHVQSNKNLRIMLHGSSSCAEDRLAHASNPR